jgi:hypothetical protein
MTTYICPRCNYTTSRKSNIRNHIIRKNLCKPTHKDVSIKSIANSYGIEFCSTENLDVVQNVVQKKRFTVNRNPIQNIQIPSISNDLDKNVVHKYNCEFCNKSFATRQGKYKHKKKCKFKNKDKEIIITQEELKKKIKEAEKNAEKKAEKKIDVIADKRAQKMVLALANKLVPNQTNSNNTNTHNIKTQNIQNIQNNNNNNNQQLKINNFGEEKTHYITDEQLKIMFVDPRNTVIQHIKDTHYHLLHPENFNAKITNYKSKHMKVYENNMWVIKNKKAMICKMYNKHEKIISEAFERIKDQLSKQVRENYKEYSSSVHSSFHTYNQRLLDTEAVVLTGSMQQKNIESLRSEEVLRLAEEQGKTPSEIFAEHIIAQEHDNILEAERLNKLGITDI